MYRKVKKCYMKKTIKFTSKFNFADEVYIGLSEHSGLEYGYITKNKIIHIMFSAGQGGFKYIFEKDINSQCDGEYENNVHTKKEMVKIINERAEKEILEIEKHKKRLIEEINKAEKNKPQNYDYFKDNKKYLENEYKIKI